MISTVYVLPSRVFVLREILCASLCHSFILYREGQGVRESGSQGVRESGSQGVTESGSQGVRESESQGVWESGSQRVSKSCGWHVCTGCTTLRIDVCAEFTVIEMECVLD